jgi:hypothetical protein
MYVPMVEHSRLTVQVSIPAKQCPLHAIAMGIQPEKNPIDGCNESPNENLDLHD